MSADRNKRIVACAGCQRNFLIEGEKVAPVDSDTARGYHLSKSHVNGDKCPWDCGKVVKALITEPVVQGISS